MLFRTQVARIRRQVDFRLYLPLGRTGNELVLSRGGIESYLVQLLLLVRRQLGLNMDLPLLVNKTAVV